jgi:drug/metabolite transporter (DMT)-like permease
MVAFTLIVAGSFPVAAAITAGIDPTVLTFWRFLSATIIFALMLPFAKGATRRPGWKDLLRYCAVGGSYALFFILMFQALKETSALNTGTIYTILPLLTMLLGGLLGEPFRMKRMAILALSMVAALWVIFRGNVQQMVAFQLSRGDLVFFIGTGCLAVYMVAMKRCQRVESKLHFLFYSLLVATAALLITALLRKGTLPFPNPRQWLGIAYLAGPSTVGTFWILQRAVLRLGPNRVVAYTFLNPSAVAALEWGLGLSAPDWKVLPGIGITLLAVWLLQAVAEYPKLEEKI